MDGEASSSSQTPNLQPNDLIWAKMKGFPPWPAKVLKKTEDTPARRIPVMFFGTLETSFMKPSDLSDYLTNRTIHEIPRKQKDFNKAVQEIRKAAGISSEQDDVQFPIAPKSPPSSPVPGRVRQTSGRFLDVIMSGGPDTRRKRSNSASTKSRSRASSSASVLRAVKDMMKKERRRLDSESSNGSKRKMISGGITGNGSIPHGSDYYEQHNYADSIDFNNLFGDAFLGELLPDDNKSWKSKRSRGSSKILDDFLFSQRTRNRSGSASGRRSRMISMSGFSGISDMFEEFLNAPVDMEAHAEQLLMTLNSLPADGSVDRPLSPELLAPLPGPVEFCSSCGYECRMYNNVWRCTSNHCAKYKESAQSASAVEGMLEEEHNRNRDKMNIPMSVNVKTESVSSGEKMIRSMLMAKPGTSRAVEPSCALSTVKREPESPVKVKRGNLVINIKQEDVSASETTNRHDAAGREKKKRRVQVMSPRSPNIHFTSTHVMPSTSDDLEGGRQIGRTSPSPRRDRSRPKHYKVEKTPPISASGHRHCVNCDGQVRPQMCGGNRHRWRCVDKKCRKWYGWVRSHEEIPKNVGRKKVQSLKSSAIMSKPMKIKKVKEEEDESRYPVVKRKVGRPSKNDIKIRLKLEKEAAAAIASKPVIINPPIDNSNGANNLQRRKYTKRKAKDSGIGMKGENTPFDEDVKKRPTSPLTEKESCYRPCAMEKRARWWTGEKRRVDVSPERDFGTTAADTAAAFRMMAQSVRSAAVTRADEVGTVNGSLDLLMDSLIGSMAPLLSLLQKVPALKIDPELSQKLWNSSAVHIPTFQ